MKRLLREIKKLMKKIFGTKADEFYWRFRHIFNKEWVKDYISQESLNHPHREFLIDRISNCASFKNILEIGCASGPNLYLLSKRFSDIKLYGIDISKQAVICGRNWFKTQNIKNIYISSGRAENLNRFSDKSIDIIFTDATLIYVGPDKIKKVASEMVRVAKKSIILLEHRSEKENALGRYNDGNWLRNYKALFQPFAKRIKITKISPQLWEGDWRYFGYLVEVWLK